MSTPILDRERSLPARKPPSVALKFLNAFALVVGGLLGAAAIGPWFPRFRSWVEVLYTDWFRARLDEGAGRLDVYLSAIAAYYAAVTIHELGHVLAGTLVGYRLRQLRIGPVLLQRPFSLSVAARGWFGGHALMSPDSSGRVAWKEVVLALGGPVANLMTAFALLAMPGMLPLFGGYLLVFSLVHGLAPMIPARTGTGFTDGTRVAMHLGDDPRGARRLALSQLQRDLTDGVPPNRSDPKLFRTATAISDASADTVLAHVLTFQREWLDRRVKEAGEYLETALAFSLHASESMREALKSEAASYQARYRGRVDLAEQWLAEVSNPPIRPWNRLRPEAAILAAKGDVAAAIAKLGEVERALSALPPGGVRDLSFAELRDWRAQLEALMPA